MKSQTLNRSGKRSRLAFLICILGFLSLVFVRTPPFALSPDDLVDSEFETAADLHRLKAEFNIQEGLQLIFEKKGENGFTLEEGCALRDWTARESLAEPLLSGVNSPFSLREVRTERDPSSNSDRIWFARLLEPDCESLETKGSEPFDLSQVLSSPWKGSLVSASGRDLVVELSYGQDFQPEVVEGVIERAKTKLLSRFPDLRLHVGGLHAFRYSMHNAMKGMLGVNFAALVLLAVFFRLFLGRWLGFFLLLGSLALTFAAVWIGMAFTGIPLDLVNSNLFLMILIATVADFVYLSFPLLSGVSSEEAIRRMRWPSFFTSFTTWIGFTSLAFSNLEIVRRFGIPAGAAALLEWFVVFSILPMVLRNFPVLDGWVRPEKAVFRDFTTQLSAKKIPRWIAILLLGAIPGAALVAPHLTYRELPAYIFPADHPLRKSSEYYAQTRDSQASGEIVFTTIGDEAANRAVITKVRALPEVSRVEDPYENEAFILRNLDKDAHDQFLATLRSSPEFAPWMSKSREVKAHFDVRDPDISAMNQVRAKVSEFCPKRECWLAGSFVSYAEFGDKVRQTLVSSLIGSLFFVGLVIVALAWWRGYRREIPVLVGTALWGPAFCCVLVGVFSIPVGIVSCLFAATLTGLTGDNTIQFLFASEKRDLEEASSSFGGAAITLSGMMICLSLIFFFSPFATARVLGGLLALGFMASLIGDLWLLRGLLREKPVASVEEIA